MFGMAFAAGPDIIIRHDTPDHRYRALGEKYRQTVVEIALPTGSADRPRRGNGNGTLVAPQWILTAAHVASVIMPGHPRNRASGTHIVYIADRPYEVDRVFLHPAWTRMDSPADLALIKIKTAAAGGVPACLYPNEDEVSQVAVLVGNGLFGTGLRGPIDNDAYIRGATVRIEGVKADGTLLWWPFRAPGDPDVTELEGISGPGDSGGPAFLHHEGRCA